MIACRVYRDGKLEEEGFDPELISDYLDEGSAVVWLDLVDPSPQELALLQEEFGLHELAIEDVLHRRQRPKIEGYGDHFFLVAHGFSRQDDELVDHEVHAFVAPSYLITIRFSPSFDLAPILLRWDQRPSLAAEGGGGLLYAILDEIVDRYFDIADGFEDVSDEIGDTIFSDEADDDVRERIFDLKKQVIDFRKRAAPLREALSLLQSDERIVTQPLQNYYRDVTDHLIRVREGVDSTRELLTVALEAHLGQVSNKLNVVMKKLTGWASIVLVPTLIAGIYGMNFRHMPELNWLFGYPFALALMAVSGGALYMAFRRRGWL